MREGEIRDVLSCGPQKAKGSQLVAGHCFIISHQVWMWRRWNERLALLSFTRLMSSPAFLPAIRASMTDRSAAVLGRDKVALVELISDNRTSVCEYIWCVSKLYPPSR